jgi:hypothetical protein
MTEWVGGLQTTCSAAADSHHHWAPTDPPNPTRPYFPHQQAGHVKLTNFDGAHPAAEPAVNARAPGYLAPENNRNLQKQQQQMNKQQNKQQQNEQRRNPLGRLLACCGLARPATQEDGDNNNQQQAPDGRAADVWALAITVLQLVYPADAVAKWVPAMRAGKWAPPATLARQHPELADLLASMLHVDPARRLRLFQVRGHGFFRNVDWAAMEVCGARGAPAALRGLLLQR